MLENVVWPFVRVVTEYVQFYAKYGENMRKHPDLIFNAKYAQKSQHIRGREESISLARGMTAS